MSRIISSRAAEMSSDKSRVDRDGSMWSLESGGESVEGIKAEPWRRAFAVDSDETGRMQDVRNAGTDLLRKK